MSNALLILFPYWSPVVPPAGLARIKAYLEQRGHRCRILDLNTKKESQALYQDYYAALKKHIPGKHRGTLFNLGNDLMEQHVMAYVMGHEHPLYLEHVLSILRYTFQSPFDEAVVHDLDAHVAKYLAMQAQYLEYQLRSFRPQMVGVTAYKTTLPLTIQGLRTVKALDPTILTVMGGGVFVDTLNRETPEFQRFLARTTDCIDKVVIGEGERLAEMLISGSAPADQRCFSAEELWPEGRAEPLEWPIPDFSDFNTFKYSHLVATASTGCPFTCSFCNELQFYGKYRKRKAAPVVREMKELSRQNHAKRLFFMTDSLLNPVVDDLCTDLIEADVDYYMDTYFRASKQAMHPEKCLYWRKGGLYRVRLGLESGSQRMLDIMNKESTVEQARGTLRSLAAAGIKTTTYWIIGHPGETEADFQATLDLLEEMRECIWQAECNPFRYYPMVNNQDDEWRAQSMPVFDRKFEDLYLYSPHRVTDAPDVAVVQDRVARFILHIGRLQIPNPYSAYETFLADKRWQQLHALSVPSIQQLNAVEPHVDAVKHSIRPDLTTRTATFQATPVADSAFKPACTSGGMT